MEIAGRLLRFLNNVFLIEERGSTLKKESLAALTTFMSMCYILFVVPSMLAETGMPKESVYAATIWVTICATLIMGFFARFPVGVAPGLGISAFFAYSVCGPAGFTWQTGLGAVFISGCVFLLLTVTRVRQMIIDAVPMDLKYAIVVGIGLFIAFIGLKGSGFVVAHPSTYLALGNLHDPHVLLALLGLFLGGAFLSVRVPGALMIAILLVTLLGILLGVTPLPDSIVFSASLPLPSETFLQLDIKGALEHGLFSIIFTLTMVDLFDNMGVLIALSQKAGFFRSDGSIENLDRALVADSCATMLSALIGATTATSYLESASGITEGGRTGFCAVLLALFFFLALFFAPLLTIVPSYATSPILVLVGAMMIQEVKRIHFDDFTIALPAFLTIVIMPLTFNIANGFGFGFLSYVFSPICLFLMASFYRIGSTL